MSFWYIILSNNKFKPIIIINFTDKSSKPHVMGCFSTWTIQVSEIAIFTIITFQRGNVCEIAIISTIGIEKNSGFASF